MPDREEVKASLERMAAAATAVEELMRKCEEDCRKVIDRAMNPANYVESIK